MLTHLVGRHAHHVQRLALWRVQLDQQMPAVSLSASGAEGLLYALTGTVSVYVDGQYTGSLGTRHRVDEECAQAVRCRACQDVTVVLWSQTYAADVLWITCETGGGSSVPMLDKHYNDALWHTVGEGTHRRRVAEIPTPPGAMIFCGETHNIPGGISSWPPHASAEDIGRFANGDTTWEEVIFFICDAPGIANLNGVYTGNVSVLKYQEIRNGDAYVMPLGSHPIHAGPGASMMYVWAYCGTALQKTYNAASTDLGTYRK